MSRRLHPNGEFKARLLLTDAPKRRVGAVDLASAFGASEVVAAPASGGSPADWFAVREETAKRLLSAGGRPGLPDAEPHKAMLSQPVSGRLHPTEDVKPRVLLTDAPKRRVSTADLAAAFGASEVVAAPASGGSPAAWFAVREEIAQRLRSTGGRPGLPDAEPRKVTLTQHEWDMVKQLSEAIAEPGFRPSAGQVAGVLLGHAIRSAHASLPAVAIRRRVIAE